ncbi:Disintegrin and metalloproteinase domain-containing protein 12 [Chionoecetes opilio]|uniref:Disintegrin and metalloproteinase domain-containing protein 12 n=1 Tax=Chionoecetes opilio TaxID=41210 RepID=A0A8J5CZG2_CHIOP|nr:Disintegrin and metalloproteinase domain-containing protein 12 [Chionoecetes opilio]
MDYCLRNKPTSLFDSPVCGNGFVEPGEQCDCGLPDYCTNTCCNATTCMLYPNATCATGHCCDLQTCRPRMAGRECRASVHECDLPEFCTGDSEYCPSDVFKADGHQCQHGQAFCHGGMCRTHGEQCKLLWGPTGQSSDDQCYRMNTQGSHKGNCGYNWVNDTYYRCTSNNIKCGLLHCMHLNERLEFGMESVSKVSHSFLKGKEGVIPVGWPWWTWGWTWWTPAWPLMALSVGGARSVWAWRGQMCVNQRCMAVADLKVATCDCHGNGVCNNYGHCHCHIGWAPPECLYPGLGGSKDSGPASNPHGRPGLCYLSMYPSGSLCYLSMHPSGSLCYLSMHPSPSL